MTPFEQNYRVPGRFEEHECTFITWPCLASDLEIVNFEKDNINLNKILEQKYLMINKYNFQSQSQENKINHFN